MKKFPSFLLIAIAIFAAPTLCGQSGLLVSSDVTGDVRLYSPPPGPATQTTFVAPGSGGLGGPQGLAFDAQGNLYVGGSTNGGAVFEYDKTGAFVKVLVPARAGGLIFPEGMTFGPDGLLYICNNDPSGKGSVLRFDGKTGAFVDAFVPNDPTKNGGLDEPFDLTFGPDGNLYVSSSFVVQGNNMLGGAVLRYDGSTGTFKDYFVAPGSNGLSFPWGLTFGPDYNLYVANGGANSVMRFDGRNGTFIDNFVPANSGQLNSPSGIVFGPDMNLYVGSVSNNAVKRYNGQTGTYIDDYVSSSTGLNFPTFLAFSQDQSCPQSVRDSDGDGIPDCWELHGVNVNGSVITFPGANPYHKDIFVEVDWLPSWQPTQNALDIVTQAFANAPVNNLDGTTGVNLHLVADEQINSANGFPTFNNSQWITFHPCADPSVGTPDFGDLEKQYFGTAAERSDPNATALLKVKAAVYHYGIFAYGLLNTSFSGCAALPGRIFTVSLGGWGFGNNDSTQAASLMHELGHNLGLWHGGFPDDPTNNQNSFNCKPNYLSVMSYSREYDGVWVNNRPLDFSRQALPTLYTDLGAGGQVYPGLDETKGIGFIPNARTFYTCPNFVTQIKNADASGAIDWDCSGNSTGTGIVNQALNQLYWTDSQQAKHFLCQAGGDVLQGYDDWANLQLNFNGPSNGAGGAPIGIGTPQMELTFDAVLSAAQDTVPPVISTNVSPTANIAGWNNSNVGITVNCVDTSASPYVSGLQAITLSGALSATSTTSPLSAILTNEGTNQQVGVSCSDNAQNVSTAKLGPFSIDKTPPVVTVTGVTNGAVYTFGSAIPAAGCNTTDALSGVQTNATVSVTGGTNGAGTFTATCSGAMDVAGNTAPPVNVTFTVQYNFNGYFNPILNNGSAYFHSGRTIPVKFQLTAADGSIVSNAVANLQVFLILNTPAGTVDESIDTLAPGNSNSGTLFRFDPTSNQYVYNLSTSGYASGTYLLRTTISDGSTHDVQFSIK